MKGKGEKAARALDYSGTGVLSFIWRSMLHTSAATFLYKAKSGGHDSTQSRAL